MHQLRLTLTPFDEQLAELLTSFRSSLAPQPLLTFGRWALVQRESLASSPQVVATVACAFGFLLGAAFAASVLSSRIGRSSNSEKKQENKAPAAAATTRKANSAAAAVTLLATASPCAPTTAATTAVTTTSKLESLLREASSARDAAERDAAEARGDAAALREKVAALEGKLAASQRTRRAVAAELAAAFGLPPTPAPASAPPKSYYSGGNGGGERSGPSPPLASRFFASPPPPASEGRASRVAKALAAA